LLLLLFLGNWYADVVDSCLILPNFKESQLDGFLDFGISLRQGFPWEQRSIPVPKRYHTIVP
jgi:hypothetical protein